MYLYYNDTNPKLSQKKVFCINKRSFILTLLFTCLSIVLWGQDVDESFVFLENTHVGEQYTESESNHELTIFIVNSAMPLNWDTPSDLYYSLKKSYFKTVCNRKKRFLGHTAFYLNSSLLKQPLWMGIAQNANTKILQQLFIKKIGMGIVGHPFRAKIEDKKLLRKNLLYNAKHNQVRAITFKINENAVERMLDFLTVFQSENHYGYASSEIYGGMFWPLYDGEGAGCTALCMSVLEAGGIELEDQDLWKIQLHIPMELVGGEHNKGKKVNLKKIKKTNTWHIDKGKLNEDFVDFEIYSPNFMFDWVDEKLEKDSSYRYYLDDAVAIPSVYLDYSETKQPKEPVTPLKKRTDLPFLLKVFYEKIK